MSTRTRHAKPLSSLLCALLAWGTTLQPSQVSAGELNEVPPRPAPALTLPDLNGQPRELAEFAGRVVMVNFWASWCAPCIAEMPGLQRLEANMAEQPFTLLMVNVAEHQRRVEAALNRLGARFTVLLDRDSQAFTTWGANVFPTTYVLDRAGRVRYLGRGPLDWDLEEHIALLQALANQAPGDNTP